MLQASILTTLILAILEAYCRYQFGGITSITPLGYLYSALFSLGFWFVLALFAALASGFLRYLIVLLVGLLFPLLVFSNFVLYREFGEYVSAFMLMFAQKDPYYLIDYIQKYALTWVGMLYGISALLTIHIWHPSNLEKEHALSKKSLIGGIFVSTIFTLVVFNQLKKETVGQAKLADGSFFVALDTVIKGGKTKGLRSSIRKAVAAVSPPAQLPHVFLFIGESWAKRNFAYYSNLPDRLPILTETLSANKDRTIVFQRGLTNSSATDVSLPSLLSGVGPEESDVKLHELPLLWDLAKGAGYKTIFISPQRLAFAHIDHFLLTPGPDIFLPGDSIGGKVINDNGIDAITAAKKFSSLLKQDNLKQPLFVIYFSNSLHFPFQVESRHLKDIPNYQSRYEKALHIMDKEIEILIQSFKEREIFQNTLFWLTADHGEVETNTRVVPRVASFYQEIISIPFIVMWPRTNFRPDCFSLLRNQVHVNVQNLDIAPTLVDLWGLKNSPQNQDFIQKYRGQTLCSQLSHYRPLIHLNTNNTRQWNPEGFAITRGDERYHFTNIEGTQYFNTATDPEMKKNQWEKISPDFLKFVSKTVQSEPELTRISSSYKNIQLSPEAKGETTKDTTK